MDMDNFLFSCVGPVQTVNLLVIVLIIDEDYVLAHKPECQTLVSADTDRPMIFELSYKRMKLPSWGIQIAWSPGIVESKQLQSQLARMFRLNSSLRPRAKEFLYAAVPEALNHSV